MGPSFCLGKVELGDDLLEPYVGSVSTKVVVDLSRAQRELLEWKWAAAGQEIDEMLGELAGKPHQIPINLEVLRDLPVFGFPLNHNSLIFSHGMPGVFHMCLISKRRGGPPEISFFNGSLKWWVLVAAKLHISCQLNFKFWFHDLWPLKSIKWP